MKKIFSLMAAVFLLTPAVSSAMVQTGASRSHYFEEFARLAELRGDRSSAAMLRVRGRDAALAPPELSSSAVGGNGEYAVDYSALRLRVRQAILSPAHAPAHQWRVDRAEAALHLAARELEKGARASTTLLQKLLADATWTLDHQIVPYDPGEPVTPPPAAWIQAYPTNVPVGKSSLVTWKTSDATSATINGEAVSLTGSRTVLPTEQMKFDLVATGPGGSASADATVTAYFPSPTASISVRPGVIEKGQSAILIWNTTNADTAWINGSPESLTGSREVSPDATTTYDVTAMGRGGQAAASTFLTVIRRLVPKRFRIHFDFDESVIRRDAVDTMTAVARLLREHPDMRMKIEGHCDARGGDAYNEELGMRRAESVRNYFVERFGLSPLTFDPISRGENDPISPNIKQGGADNPEGREINRRAEFVEILQ